MRLLSKSFHWKTQNGNKLISSIISPKSPQNDLEMGILSAVINNTKNTQKCCYGD